MFHCSAKVREAMLEALDRHLTADGPGRVEFFQRTPGEKDRLLAIVPLVVDGISPDGQHATCGGTGQAVAEGTINRAVHVWPDGRRRTLSIGPERWRRIWIPQPEVRTGRTIHLP